jgi:hypothetical protein
MEESPALQVVDRLEACGQPLQAAEMLVQRLAEENQRVAQLAAELSPDGTGDRC